MVQNSGSSGKYDKNTIIGLVLIGLLFFGYLYISKPSAEEIAREKHINDSIAALQKVQDTIIRQKQTISQSHDTTSSLGATSNVSDTTINQASSDTIKNNALLQKYGKFANAVDNDSNYYILENDLLKAKISAKGGRIAEIELKNYKKYDTSGNYENKPYLKLFEEQNSSFQLIFTHNYQSISTADLSFQSQIDSVYATKNQPAKLSLKLFANNNKKQYIEYLYSIDSNSYMLNFDINVVGMSKTISGNSIDVDWHILAPRQEKSFKIESSASTIYYQYKNDEDVDYLSEMKDDDEDCTAKLKWISFKQQFFSTILVADNADGFSDARLKTVAANDEKNNYVKNFYANFYFPYTGKETENYNMRMYCGPNHYKTLKKFDLDFERQLPLGWGFFIIAWVNKFIVIPVFNFLDQFDLSYGLIILLLTIFIKTLLFPIAYKTYMSSARMKVLKPETDKLNKKFPNKEDAMKKQQAMMQVYRNAGVNPMAGCVPMLLQMPILYALFRFFPASIELRQQPFLWADDLSSYDAIISWDAHIPIISTFYGNHVSLFTLLMTISMVIYTKVNSQMMGTQNSAMPGMKTMMYIMPVMFMGFLNSYSSGLSYYYFLANMVTFAQQFVIRKFFINEEKILQKIKEKQKNPKKKKQSAFQKRMEEMAKQRGYKMPK